MDLSDLYIQASLYFIFRLAIALHMSEIGLLIRVLTTRARAYAMAETASVPWRQFVKKFVGQV
jgi:hypothetical protein